MFCFLQPELALRLNYEGSTAQRHVSESLSVIGHVENKT